MIQKIFLICLLSITTLSAKEVEVEAINDYTMAETFSIEEEGGFNVGIGVGVILLDKPDIIEAIVDNGKVLVTDEEKQKLGFWLTSSWVDSSWPSENIQVGPFIGVQLFDQKSFLNSVAIGLNLSFMKVRYGLPLDFQIGWAWTRTSQLATGYNENETLPIGATVVQKKDVISNGFIFLTSYKF